MLPFPFSLAAGTLTWGKNTTSPDSMPPGCTRTSPSGRRGHSSVLYKDAIHVYGGFQDLRGSSSDLWIFDLSEHRLSLLPSYSSVASSSKTYQGLPVVPSLLITWWGEGEKSQCRDPEVESEFIRHWDWQGKRFQTRSHNVFS